MNKKIIIANEIGKLYNPNKGYTQRPFSTYVPTNLKSNIQIKRMNYIFFFF